MPGVAWELRWALEKCWPYSSSSTANGKMYWARIRPTLPAGFLCCTQKRKNHIAHLWRKVWVTKIIKWLVFWFGAPFLLSRSKMGSWFCMLLTSVIYFSKPSSLSITMIAGDAAIEILLKLRGLQAGFLNILWPSRFCMNEKLVSEINSPLGDVTVLDNREFGIIEVEFYDLIEGQAV